MQTGRTRLFAEAPRLHCSCRCNPFLKSLLPRFSLIPRPRDPMPLSTCIRCNDPHSFHLGVFIWWLCNEFSIHWPQFPTPSSSLKLTWPPNLTWTHLVAKSTRTDMKQLIILVTPFRADIIFFSIETILVLFTGWYPRHHSGCDLIYSKSPELVS